MSENNNFSNEIDNSNNEIDNSDDEIDNSNNKIDNFNNVIIDINDITKNDNKIKDINISKNNNYNDNFSYSSDSDIESNHFNLDNYKRKNTFDYKVVNRGEWNYNSYDNMSYNNDNNINKNTINNIYEDTINNRFDEVRIEKKDFNVNIIKNETEYKLYNTITTNTALWLTYLSVVQYEYNFYQSLNTTTSVLIILLSSCITLLEGLKSTTSLKIHFDLISLILSFLISLIASLIKFFNFQLRMEILKTILDNLDSSYIEGNELFNTYVIFLTNDYNNPELNLKNKDLNDKYNKKFNSFWEEWQRISSNTVRPLSNISKLIDPQVLVIYKERFFKQQELEDIITKQNKFFTKLNNNYLSEIEFKEDKGNRFYDKMQADKYTNYRYIMRNYLENSKLPKSNVKKNLKYYVRSLFG